TLSWSPTWSPSITQTPIPIISQTTSTNSQQLPERPTEHTRPTQQPQQQSQPTTSAILNDNTTATTSNIPDNTEPASPTDSTDNSSPTDSSNTDGQQNALSDDQVNLIIQFNIDLSITSIIGGLLVLLVIASMWRYDKKLVNRVSLRLTAVISFVDVLNAIALIIYTNYTPDDTPLCTGIAAALSFFPQVYLFLTVMIAFNLQLVFLHRRKISKFSDRWYIPVAILAALVCNVPPLVLNRFGFDEASADCYYRDSKSTETFYWILFAFIIPILFAMVYCTVVFVIVVFKIVFENRKLAETVQTGSATLSMKAKKQKLLVLRLASRISLYACIPVLSVAGIVVMFIWSNLAVGVFIPYWVTLWSVIGSSLPAFIFDPAVHNAVKKVRRELVRKYGYPTDQMGSTTSRSTFSPPPSPSIPISPSFRMSNADSFVPGNNRFMIWFVRKFLAPKQRVSNPMTTTISSASNGYNYPRSQREGHRHSVADTSSRADNDSDLIGVAISTPDNTVSTAASSYATFDSSSRLMGHNNDTIASFHNRYDRENSIYSQYYYSSEDVEAMGNSRPSSSIDDESEWEQYEMTAL
ncbi:12487_t:CDS:2, partial [Ambispora leptoticha]